MRRIVLDTNCLLQALPSRSPYHKIWTEILAGHIILCVNTDILSEYEEIIGQKTNADDNKFVDCAVAADAEYIVTNDTHFDILQHIDWPKVNVINIKEFAKQLE